MKLFWSSEMQFYCVTLEQILLDVFLTTANLQINSYTASGIRQEYYLAILHVQPDLFWLCEYFTVAASSTCLPTYQWLPLSPVLPGSFWGQALDCFHIFFTVIPRLLVYCKISLFSLVWHRLRYSNSLPSPPDPSHWLQRHPAYFLWLFFFYVSFQHNQKGHKQKACKVIKLIFFICHGASLLSSL